MPPRRRGQICPHGNRLSCPDRHARDDARLGEPLCPDCYDYTGAVLFNACASELWRRFTITLRRTLARRAGLSNKALAAQLRLSYAKVAEYQRRGVVHFHAIIRLDGPAGPSTAPPTWATLDLLTAAIAQAAKAVHLETPAAPGLSARTLAWGRELDIRTDHHGRGIDRIQVAAYVAKYATKAAECTGTLDRRITPADQLDALPIREHARRHIAECIRLSKLPGLEDLRLAAWAHMLGFSGHFSTKSRAYSTTLGALRADRAAYQRELAIAAGLLPDLASETTVVVHRLALHRTRPIAGHAPASDGGCGMTRLLLTVPEAAEALAISRSKLYELIAAGLVRSVRIDGSRRVPVEALEIYVAHLLDREETEHAKAS